MKATFGAALLLFFIVNTFAQPNPLDSNVFGYWIPSLRPIARSMPTPLQIRFLNLMMNSAWEPWSQYTTTSKGFLVGDTYRRPINEHTVRNKNTAIAYSIHSLIRYHFPLNNATWDNLLAGLGLPPNDGNKDPSTPMGLSNVCFEAFVNYFNNDGWNFLGDMGGQTYNRVPYGDYTGYKPRNSPYDLENIDPDKWQPQFVSDATYFPKEQVFVIPQAAYGKTFAVNVRSKDYEVAKIANKWRGNRQGYAAQVEQILAESRALDDRKKVVSEFFDDKFNSLGTLTRFVAGFNIDRFVIIETLVNLAFQDGVSLMWHHKLLTDSVRPVSAVRYLRKNQDIQAWGGPRQGVVTMKGREWSPYLRTDSHTEYPSGTSCLCNLFAEVLRNYDGSDKLNFTITFPRGSSFIEPGFTPQQDVTVTYPTLTEMARECSNSRNWGGVHFLQAIDEGSRVCTKAGNAVYNKFMKYLRGDADAVPRT